MREELTTFEDEIWKDIEGFEKSYQISNCGRVRNIKRMSIKIPQVNHKGYLTVGLFNTNNKTTRYITIHRLVGKAFIPNPEDKPQINHIDGVKTNNKVENLEWVTNMENRIHAKKLNLIAHPYGEKNIKAKLSEKDIKEIKILYNSGKTIKEIAVIKKLKVGIIRPFIYGTTWKKDRGGLNKRDDRKIWTKEHSINSLLSKLNSPCKNAIKPVAQYDTEGNLINIFRSIKSASDITGIPKVSIASCANNVPFHNKDKTKVYYMEYAGAYIWRKVENVEQIKNFINA